MENFFKQKITDGVDIFDSNMDLLSKEDKQEDNFTNFFQNILDDKVIKNISNNLNKVQPKTQKMKKPSLKEQCASYKKLIKLD